MNRKENGKCSLVLRMQINVSGYGNEEWEIKKGLTNWKVVLESSVKLYSYNEVNLVKTTDLSCG